jgi:hypothetical protein
MNGIPFKFGDIDARKLYVFLIVAILVLAILSLAGTAYMRVPGANRFQRIVHRLNFLDEGNIPTWFISILMFACALTTWGIYTLEKRRGGRFRAHWAALAVIFLLLSMEEVAAFHEMLNGPLQELLKAGGLLTFAWLVPGIGFCAVFLMAYWGFLRALDGRTRARFVVSGAIFLSGTVLLEMFAGARVSSYGYSDLVYALLSTFEELLEMLGVATFLYALLRYLGSYGRADGPVAG